MCLGVAGEDEAGLEGLGDEDEVEEEVFCFLAELEEGPDEVEVT